MDPKIIILLIFLSNAFSCNGQVKNDTELEVIVLYNVQYSKIPPKYDKELLAKVSHSDPKNFTSGISGETKGKE